MGDRAIRHTYGIMWQDVDQPGDYRAVHTDAARMQVGYDTSNFFWIMGPNGAGDFFLGLHRVFGGVSGFIVRSREATSSSPVQHCGIGLDSHYWNSSTSSSVMVTGEVEHIVNTDGTSRIRFNIPSGNELAAISNSGDFYPATAGRQNLGTASLYWNEINYKTLTDRGCPSWIEPKIALETIASIKPHPTKKSIHKMKKVTVYKGLLKEEEENFPSFDSESLPEWLRALPSKPDEQEGLRFDLLVYTLVTAVKELKDQVDSLKAELEKLKKLK